MKNGSQWIYWSEIFRKREKLNFFWQVLDLPNVFFKIPIQPWKNGVKVRLSQVGTIVHNCQN